MIFVKKRVWKDSDAQWVVTMTSVYLAFSPQPLKTTIVKKVSLVTLLIAILMLLHCHKLYFFLVVRRINSYWNTLWLKLRWARKLVLVQNSYPWYLRWQLKLVIGNVMGWPLVKISMLTIVGEPTYYFGCRLRASGFVATHHSVISESCIFLWGFVYSLLFLILQHIILNIVMYISNVL